jgi:hypothetical protein
MWSADFNDAPNLVDEAMAEVHRLKKIIKHHENFRVSFARFVSAVRVFAGEV